MGEAAWLSLAVCSFLGLCHLAAPLLLPRMQREGSLLASFSGGAASAYVFLRLLPELETTHRTVGEQIHLIVLAGFVFLFVLDTLLATRFEGAETGRSRFLLRLGLLCVYNLLLAFTMSEQLPMSPLGSVGYAMALGLHVMVVDLKLLEEYGPARYRAGRWLLVASLLGGWLLSLLTQAPEELLDVLTALMAGFIIYTVFSEELPKRRGFRAVAFITGVLLFWLLDALSS